jgi:hypothetical protein
MDVDIKPGNINIQTRENKFMSVREDAKNKNEEAIAYRPLILFIHQKVQ